MCPVADRLGGDHAGICQLIDDLLQGQKIRVFFSEDKVAYLCGSEGKGNAVQHIENDEFV